jgi:TRAP-type C4-dicarboxylate transport system substrate-binding protein
MRLLATALAIALVTSGCHGSGAGKAGGTRAVPGKPLTLTLQTGDSLFAPEYADAVNRLSDGTMRIAITVAGNQPTYEAMTVDAVRKGKAQLGAVGARVWDAFGATSFRPLVAPFLVDSLALEQQVLSGPLAARMLGGLDKAGVVGLAVLPGPLRRPLGLSRGLVAPADYKGAKIAIRYGGIARTSFEALGSTAVGYTIGNLPAVDGAELDSNTIAENGFDAQARALTANVVFWPRPQTIFMNRKAFDRLSSSQQAILRRAGRAAVGPELARVQKDDASGLAAICSRGTLSLVTASPDEVAALRGAVGPVYAELNRDPLDRQLIRAIAKLREALPSTDAARCPGTRAVTRAGAVLEGRWQMSATSGELQAAGVPPADADRQRGGGTLVLAHGAWIGRERLNGFVWHGRYSVQGNVLRLITTACPPALACGQNATATFTWSVYEDRLSLGLVSGVPTYLGLIAKPLTKAH